MQYGIDVEIVEMVRHILDARIDNAPHSAALIWLSARDIFEYALANNMECLKEFDYLMTQEETDISDYWCNG